MSLHVQVFILGRSTGSSGETTLILNELPRIGEILNISTGRSIVVQNITTRHQSSEPMAYDAIVAGPLARS